MDIALVDVDNRNFPNLALMKISAYHKEKGDRVEQIQYTKYYDLAYMSKVFTFSQDEQYNVRADKIIKGGTGYKDLVSILPDEIESAYPDYSLYPKNNAAIGFMSRGCFRSCPFCIVNEKEGRPHKVADLDQFWRGQKEIILLDPNILAVPERLGLLEQLIRSKAYVDFSQGLDIRLIDDEIIAMLLKIKVKRIHFAYDFPDNSIIENNLARFSIKTGMTRSKVTVYVLVNYNTTIEQDLERIRFIKGLNFNPYITIYEKEKLPKGSIYHKLIRWCNRPQILWSCEFSEYKARMEG